MTDPETEEAVDRLVVEQRRLIRIGVAALVTLVVAVGFAPFYEEASAWARIAYVVASVTGVAVALINTWIFDMPRISLRRRR